MSCFLLHPLSLVLLLPVGIAAVCDLRSREIPDWVPLLIFGWAVLATALQLHNVRISMAGGALLAAIVMLPLFYFGALGGGDTKLMMAIGAAVGPAAFLSILIWMATAGAVLAVIAMARRTREFAYGPAIAVGVFVETVWPGGLAHVLLG